MPCVSARGLTYEWVSVINCIQSARFLNPILDSGAVRAGDADVKLSLQQWRATPPCPLASSCVLRRAPVCKAADVVPLNSPVLPIELHRSHTHELAFVIIVHCEMMMHCMCYTCQHVFDALHADVFAACAACRRRRLSAPPPPPSVTEQRSLSRARAVRSIHIYC
jgi:hypothetical protein